MSNTRFVTGDYRDLAETGQTFDFVTCLRVLMYLPDQAGAVATFCKLLKPNGMVLLQEHQPAPDNTTTDRPLAAQARSWVWDTVAAEGATLNTGTQLHSLLASAGFSEIAITAEAVIETPSQAAQTADLVRVMLPRIEAARVTTAAEVDIETLAERLKVEQAQSTSTSISELIFGAMARRA
ncbi:MAG: methyltransferase domain-containing protein [Pseudomonadota bacterium]